jgi:toxin ParE1/3/4
MTADEPAWTVLITESADRDYRDILAWTRREFGDLQSRRYADTLAAAIVALTAAPSTVGARPRLEIGTGLFTLHVARGGRKGRHFVLFRVRPDEQQSQVEVLRLLHDAMDLGLHVPGTTRDNR